MNERNRRFALIGIVAAATLGQVGLAGVTLVTRLSTEREARAERRTTAEYAAQLASLQSGAASPKSVARHVTLLANPDVAGTLRVLQATGDTVGVTLTSVRSLPETTPGRQVFTITGRGAPEQVCAFLADVETNERLMVIETGKVAPGTAGEVLFELGLSTHHAGGVK